MGRLIDTVAVRKGHPLIENDFEAIPKADYEARLRADMMAILKEMRAEMEYVEPHDMGEIIILNACKQVVDTRINSLKEQKDGTNEKTSDR